MSRLLQVANLAKSYGAVRAVRDVTFAVEEHAIVGIIGPNGCGKSTTIDCITGFQRPDAGSVLLGDRQLIGMKPSRIAHAGLTRTFQTVRIYDHLTLNENLLVAMQSFDAANWIDAVLRTPRLKRETEAAQSRADELVDLIGLRRYTQAPVGILSYGQKKLVALASALMSKPRLVVLDEPVAGVNPTRIREIEQAIRVLRDAGETFLVIEHNMEFIMNLCDHVFVFDQGSVLTSGKPAEVQSDARVLEAYLGIRA